MYATFLSGIKVCGKIFRLINMLKANCKDSTVMSAVPVCVRRTPLSQSPFQSLGRITSPQPFKLHVVHQEVSGLHQLVDLLQQLFLPLPVLLGLVLVCSTIA